MYCNRNIPPFKAAFEKETFSPIPNFTKYMLSLSEPQEFFMRNRNWYDKKKIPTQNVYHAGDRPHGSFETIKLC